MMLRRETLEAVLPAVDETGGVSYSTNYVQIHPDGRCMATDGHIAIVAKEDTRFPDEDFPRKGVPAYAGEPTEPILVPAEKLRRLLQAMPKKAKRQALPILQAVQITNNNEGWTLAATDLESHQTAHVNKAEQANYQFPKIDRVMVPADRPHLTLCLSVDVLENLIKAAKAVSTGKLKTLTLEIPTEISHQGRSPAKHPFVESADYCSGHDCPCKHCGLTQRDHVEPDGTIVSPVRVTVKGSEVAVEAVAMPCRV